MRRILARITLLALAACTIPPAPQAAAPTSTQQAPTTTTPDPGVRACKLAARRADAGKPLTWQEREQSWTLLQQSRYGNLRAAGVELEQAATDGTLAEQVAAAVNAIGLCASHGVQIKVKVPQEG